MPLNDSVDAPHQLQLDPQTLSTIVSQLPGFAQGPAQTVISGISPTAEVEYKADGDCDDFPGITIEGSIQAVTGTKAINATVAGIGLTVSVNAVISARKYSTLPCANNQPGKMKARQFIIRWYADVSATPGPTYGVLAKEYTQLVNTDCCPPAEEKPKGGWLD